MDGSLWSLRDTSGSAGSSRGRRLFYSSRLQPAAEDPAVVPRPPPRSRRSRKRPSARVSRHRADHAADSSRTRQSLDTKTAPSDARRDQRSCGCCADTPTLADVLAGAGFEGVTVTPELANCFGQILRVVVSGLMDVLQARQQIKEEFRLRLTHFQAGGQQPLEIFRERSMMRCTTSLSSAMQPISAPSRRSQTPSKT